MFSRPCWNTWSRAHTCSEMPAHVACAGRERIVGSSNVWPYLSGSQVAVSAPTENAKVAPGLAGPQPSLFYPHAPARDSTRARSRLPEPLARAQRLWSPWATANPAKAAPPVRSPPRALSPRLPRGRFQPVSSSRFYGNFLPGSSTVPGTVNTEHQVCQGRRQALSRFRIY